MSKIDIDDIEIENPPTNKEIEEALNGDIRDLWKIFKRLRGNDYFKNNVYNKVKYGFELSFDIRDIVEGYKEVKPAHRLVQIGRRKKFNITRYRNEEDKRDEIMAEVLRLFYDDSFDNQGEDEDE